MKELSLQYRMEQSPNPSAPLFLLVHGRAGTLDVMWTFRRTLPADATVVSVQAPVPDSKGGFSWWSVDSEITREMIQEGADKLSTFIHELLEVLHYEKGTIAALGFSQGGGALSVLMQQQPELFSKGALLASFVIKDHMDPVAGNWPEVLIVHGTSDQIVPITRAEDGQQYLKEKFGVTAQLITDDVGHKVGTQGMRALKEFFKV